MDLGRRLGARTTRRRLALPALAIASLALTSLGAAAQDAPATPTPGVLATPAAQVDCSAVPAPAAVYQIDSASSEARYVAQEELRGRGATTAVGKTNAFIGQLLFDANNAPMTCSRFDVDLRTLQSDESRRDNYLRGNTLETDTYPLATFILTEVQGLSAPLGAEEQTIRLIGNLTIRDTTRLVEWEATVKLDGDTMTGTATTSFEMKDFGITPPKVGPVLSLDELVQLQVDITAKRA